MKLSLTTKKVGKPPGNFTSQAGVKDSGDAVEILSFSSKEIFEEQIFEENIELIKKLTVEKAGLTHWIITHEPFGLRELEEYAQTFEISPMLVEDILNPYHRPKIENHAEGVFVVLRSLYHTNKKQEQFSFHEAQIVLWKYKNCVLLFSSQKLPFLNILKDQIKNGRGKIRQKKSEYLLYALLDVFVDQYYVVVSEFHKQIEVIESLTADDVSSKMITEIYAQIDLINYIKKQIFPLKDSIILTMTHNHIGIGSEKNPMHHYYKDIIDHLTQILDTLESYKDVLTNRLNLQLALNSYKLNRVMKTLTLISSIFIPLTFLVGVYGMNFKHMPEIELVWAYPAFWGVSIVMSIVMLWIFKRKKYF